MSNSGATERDDESTGTGYRVLVVDDNRVTRKLVRHTLAALGHEIIDACDGAEALAEASRSRPHLVLLDLTLPDASGFDLLAPLRSILGPDRPILAFTGLVAADEELRLRAADFDAVVHKPAEPSILREVVQAYLRPVSLTQPDKFGNGLRLLIADDDANQRKLFAFKLARLGFEVLTAFDGADALRQARAHPPDVIVSDLLMPEVDGYQLCAQIREDAALAATPVILLTNSYVEDVDRALAERVGADAYLVRSADLGELAAAIERVLGPQRRPKPPNLMGAAEVHSDHSSRVVRQLHRQLEVNSVLSRRSNLLAAELAVLGGLTRALATNHDTDEAIGDALSVCFDAGGVSWGLLISRDTKSWSTRAVGLTAAQRATLPRFDEAFVRRLELESGARVPYRVALDTLGLAGLEGAGLVVPIVLQEQMLGALVLRTGEAVDDHLVAFFEVIASQLALVIALTRSFEHLERMSRSERERAEVLASVIDAVGQPLVVVGPDGTSILTNPAGEDSTLFRRLRAAGEVLPHQFLRADVARPYILSDLPVNRALRGEAVTEEEVVVRLGDDSSCLSVTARPIRGRAGEIRGAVAIARDVTEVKRMQSRQAASDRLATVGILAAGVAHEINNPLTSIMAELEMAIEDLPADGDMAGRLRAAHDAAARVQTIVRDLRTLSRKETDSRHQVSMAQVLETAGRMASPQVRPCATFTLELGEVPSVLANEPRLVQVFLNLIVNAAQAIGPGDALNQHIVVRCRTDQGDVVAEVSDTGPGMTPEVRARLFTPFFTTKPAGVGTGLGLAISQRIVTSVGGTLECESHPGVGTTFRVRLPPRSALREEELETHTTKPLLLVIEDDPLAWQFIKRALSESYELTHAMTATEALLLLGRSAAEHETILCATEQAIELLPALRHHWPHLEAAVLLLGRQQPGGPVERPRLSKPYTRPALIAFVEDHRRHRELLKRGETPDRALASR